MRPSNISALGHKLVIEDKVEWTTSNLTLIGKIVDLSNEKATVKTLGFRYIDGDVDAIKSKIKDFYKVASKRLFLLA